MSDGECWWERPFRIFQTNLREIDATLDERKVVRQIGELGANAWLLNTAGIVSFYPSQLPFQHPSPWLRDRPSGDLIGDAVREAHANDVRVIPRADFSKVHRDVFEAHPDWCYVGASGQPQIYNGLYSTCPSGPYYQEMSLAILGEVLDRYPVDGFFFNWFNFSLRDYSGTYHGICQCVDCRRRFTERYGLPQPAAPAPHQLLRPPGTVLPRSSGDPRPTPRASGCRPACAGLLDTAKGRAAPRAHRRRGRRHAVSPGAVRYARG